MQIRLSALTLASAALAVAALTPFTASAETTTVKVPFNFTVEGKTMPAGEYKVLSGNIGSEVHLQGKNSTTSFSALTLPAQPNGGQVVLRFVVKDGTHALESIRCGASVTPSLTAPAKNHPAASNSSVGQ